MFDCGEGAQIQLSRSSLKPGRLDGIFLTHFHGDHVNGLPGLLGSLTLNQRTDALDIVGPKGLNRWMRTLRDLRILWPGFRLDVHEVESTGLVFEREDFDIVVRPLRHRIDTWGYALVEHPRPGRFDVAKARELGVKPGPLYGRLQNGEAVTSDDGRLIQPDAVLGDERAGLKIAYCTDTTPCDEAIELARDADVLIHESTYPAGNERLAHERGHSTAADAARCARDAGAQRLVLTHLSQKYPRSQDFLTDEVLGIFENTVVATDLMELEIAHKD